MYITSSAATGRGYPYRKLCLSGRTERIDVAEAGIVSVSWPAHADRQISETDRREKLEFASRISFLYCKSNVYLLLCLDSLEFYRAGSVQVDVRRVGHDLLKAPIPESN